MRVYISGPMSGIEDFNYPEFHRVANDWRKLGHDVFCPAENFNGSTDYPWSFYMKEDLRLVMHCDALVMLTGWSGSRGALMEALVARTCGIPLFDEDGNELVVSMGVIGVWLGAWEREHSYKRKNESREDNPNGSTDSPVERRLSSHIPSVAAQTSSSYSGMAGEE